MSRVSVVEAQRQLSHLKAVFKMQWRALLGALLMLIIYVLNWHFYVFELRLLTRSVLASPWVIDWITCLVTSQGNQDFCANQIDGIPKYNYIITLLFFNRTAGILIFMIFAAKKSVLLEAYDLIRGRQSIKFSDSVTSRFSVVHLDRNDNINRSFGNDNKIGDNKDGDNNGSNTAGSTTTDASTIRFSQNLPSRKSSIAASSIRKSSVNDYSSSV
jgi:hypothetical protein